MVIKMNDYWNLSGIFSFIIMKKFLFARNLIKGEGMVSSKKWDQRIGKIKIEILELKKIISILKYRICLSIWNKSELSTPIQLSLKSYIHWN